MGVLWFASVYSDDLGVIWAIAMWINESEVISEIVNTETGCVWETDQAYRIEQIIAGIDMGTFDNSLEFGDQ